MAKQSSVNLDITNNADGFDISGGTTPRKLGITGGDVTIAGSGSATVTFPTTSTTIAGLGITQSFTALQTFTAGISASGGATLGARVDITGILDVVGGVTLESTLDVGGVSRFAGGATFSGTVNGATATFNRLLTASGGISASGGMTLDGGKVWHSLNDGATSGLDAGLVHGVCGARFLENLQTGLLYGGMISVNAGNTAQVDITAGAGIVVTPGASLTAYPIPVVTPVTWTAKTGVTLSGLTSSDETWLAIDTSGNLVQTNVAFTDAQYSSQIPLGAALHLSRSYIQLIKSYPHVSYAQPEQFDPFIRAFGNLKLSGHEISANGANLTVNRSAGKAYAMGRNYKNDPNNPNIVIDTSAAPVTTIYHFYRNGSGAFTTALSGAIIPGSLDDGTGTLATVTPAKYTIQRIFYLPDQPTLLGVYYGREEYNSIVDAQANIPFEEFSESESTATQGIFCGWLIVKGNATALNNTADAKFVNAGLFRNTSNIGGGGLAIAVIDDLNDVTTTTPTNNQVLRWNNGTAQWVNSDVSSLAVSSFNGATGAVTGASLGANTFTGLNTFNAGITTAFIYASTGSTFGGTLQVNGGATFANTANFTNGLTSSGSIQFRGTTQKNIRSTQAPIFIQGVTSGSIASYNSITLPVDNSALSLGSVSGNVNIVSNSTLAAVPGLRILTDDQDFIGQFGTVIKPGTYATAERTQTLQDASGTIALTSQLMGAVNGSTAATTAVTSFNGRTGAVQGVSAAVAGTGISVSGATGAVTITNTGVTSAVAGTGISVSSATGSVTFTNIGVQSFNGGTGAVTGASLGANTFTALNTFNAGISAAGATFSGDIAVNGGDITTTSATATLYNTTATTVNIGNAASTVNLMGATANTRTGIGSMCYVKTGETTTSSTAKQEIFRYPSSQFSFTADTFFADLIITANRTITGTNPNNQITKMLVVSSTGSTINHTEYGNVNTGGNLAVYTAELSGTNVIIYATPTDSPITAFNVYATLIKGTYGFNTEE